MESRFRVRWWEVAVLAACLAAGLLLAYLFAPRPVIGVVRFEGLIDSSSAEEMSAILDSARQDDRISAVVLEIDSPGGTVNGSEKLYYSMLRLREDKPLVVAVTGMADSGGYYMAIAANKIVASASSEIGNVGVISMLPPDPLIIPTLLSTGPYKYTGGARFDGIRQIELIRDTFVENVVYQRSASPYNPLQVDANTLGEARVYVGNEALALGLVDAQGGVGDAILAAADLAGLKSYQVQELTSYLGLPFHPIGFMMVTALTESMPPGTPLLLDSRIVLGSYGDQLSLAQEEAPGQWPRSQPDWVFGTQPGEAPGGAR